MPSLAGWGEKDVIPSKDGVTLHDQLATGWSARYARGGFARRARFVDREILAAIDVSGLWLDAGCGAGDFTRMLAAKGAQARGIDGSAAMIQAARLAHPAIRFDQGRLEHLEIRSTLDGVVCLSVLEYAEDPEAVLSRLSRALKPGGRLVVSVPNAGSIIRGGQRLVRRVTGRGFAYLSASHHAWSRDELETLLARHGFEVEASRAFDPILPRFLWLQSSLWFATARKRFP